MAQGRLTFDTLQRELNRELLRHTFLRGQGAPLLFFWTLGVGLFLLILSAPLYALIWTLACLVFGFLIARDYARSPTVHGLLVRAVVRRRFGTSELADLALREAVQKGIDVFAEVAAKIAEIERRHGKDFDLRRLLTDADGMVSLQYESARHVEEFQRVLRIVDSGSRATSSVSSVNERSERTSAEVTEAARLRQQNIATIQKEAADARSLVVEIGQHLETLMLQVFQMERQAIDLVQSAELTRQMDETVDTLQATVEARRMAARSVIDALMPERASVSTPL